MVGSSRRRTDALSRLTGGRDREPGSHEIRRSDMATPERSGGAMGWLTIGGVIVILGIILAIFWSVWIGIIVAVIGLVAFGGFARGRWY
jgi:hypothetical protein